MTISLDHRHSGRGGGCKIQLSSLIGTLIDILERGTGSGRLAYEEGLIKGGGGNAWHLKNWRASATNNINIIEVGN